MRMVSIPDQLYKQLESRKYLSAKCVRAELIRPKHARRHIANAKDGMLGNITIHVGKAGRSRVALKARGTPVSPSIAGNSFSSASPKRESPSEETPAYRKLKDHWCFMYSEFCSREELLQARIKCLEDLLRRHNVAFAEDPLGLESHFSVVTPEEAFSRLTAEDSPISSPSSSSSSAHLPSPRSPVHQGFITSHAISPPSPGPQLSLRAEPMNPAMLMLSALAEQAEYFSESTENFALPRETPLRTALMPPPSRPPASRLQTPSRKSQEDNYFNQLVQECGWRSSHEDL